MSYIPYFIRENVIFLNELTNSLPILPSFINKTGDQCVKKNHFGSCSLAWWEVWNPLAGNFFKGFVGDWLAFLLLLLFFSFILVLFYIGLFFVLIAIVKIADEVQPAAARQSLVHAQTLEFYCDAKLS